VNAHPGWPCPFAQIRRKTAPAKEKMVILPPLNLPWAILAGRLWLCDFDGRNGDRFMTKGAQGNRKQGGFSAFVALRPFLKVRPFLGSSRAFLLLSCP
jgi:hypothetical protein